MTLLDPPKPAVTDAPRRLLMDPERLRAIAQGWVGIGLIAFTIDLLQQTKDGLSDGISRPFGDDFVNYWSGAFLALHGRVNEVYDFVAFHTFEQWLIGPKIDYYHYSYPPVLLLLTAPLALIPYVPALGLWLTATWYGFYRVLKLTTTEGVLLLSLATPALFINAVGGQNGALTAALLGGGLMLLDRRPIAAGVLFGLMAYKPHLALILPFALIPAKRWLAVGATAATVVMLSGASVAAFGFHVWEQYLSNLSILRALILEDGSGVWHRMISVFIFARRLGASVAWAYALQATSALVVVFFVARSWIRNDPAHIRNAMVIVGTCLVTPYLQDYDLVMGTLVVLWLHVEERPARLSAQWIRAAMTMMLLVPVLSAPISKLTGFGSGPLFFIPVFALLIWLADQHHRVTPVRS